MAAEGEAPGIHSPATSAAGNGGNEAQPKPSDPFGEMLVAWTYKRIHLANLHHRVQVSGYENLVGDIRKLLEFFGPAAVSELKKSALGSFMNLPDFNKRSGIALYHMVSRQVTPTDQPGRPNNVDTTALYFKVEGKVVRFSRIEYALVSGLNFGPTSFDPYSNNLVVPEESIYTRLFGRNDNLTPVDLHTMFVDKEYNSADDAVKMAKMLLATHYVLGFEQARIKVHEVSMN